MWSVFNKLDMWAKIIFTCTLKKLHVYIINLTLDLDPERFSKIIAVKNKISFKKEWLAMLWRCEYIPLKIALHHHNRNNSAITVSLHFFVQMLEIPSLVSFRFLYINLDLAVNGHQHGPIFNKVIKNCNLSHLAGWHAKPFLVVYGIQPAKVFLWLDRVNVWVSLS